MRFISLLPRFLLAFAVLIAISHSDNSYALEGLEAEPLTVDEAYQLQAQELNNVYTIDFFIQPDYYLYKSKFKIRAAGEDITAQLEFSDNFASLEDQFFGVQDVYRDYAQLILTAAQPVNELLIDYQGCWDGGLCYPLETRRISFVDGIGQVSYIEAQTDELILVESTGNLARGSYQYYLDQLRSGSDLYVLLLFFIAGLGLTFTPCVLPMLPILSGIITGSRGQASGERDNMREKLGLAFSYILTMSLTFSALGFFSGIIGYGLRELLGSQVFLVALALLVGALAASMLNIYTLRLPAVINSSVQNYLSAERSSYPKAITWGFLSPFIVGTCLSAPLAAAMVYLADQGNPWFGALSLLALGSGMGIPLLLFVLGLGQLLPSSGPWLSSVQLLFGLMLLALAVFILSPLLPSLVELLAYALLLLWLCYKILSRFFSAKPLLLGFIPLCLAMLLYIVFSFTAAKQQEQLFSQQLATYDAMLRTMAAAKQQETPLVFYYYADWCVSCRELEWAVLAAEETQEALAQAEVDLVKIDVTKSGPQSRALAKHFAVIGPPTFIFINQRGEQVPQLTLIGNFPKAVFVERLNSLR